jgi:hypothetical protein
MKHLIMYTLHPHIPPSMTQIFFSVPCLLKTLLNISALQQQVKHYIQIKLTSKTTVLQHTISSPYKKLYHDNMKSFTVQFKPTILYLFFNQRERCLFLQNPKRHEKCARLRAALIFYTMKVQFNVSYSKKSLIL